MMPEQTRTVQTWNGPSRWLRLICLWGMTSLLSPVAAQTPFRLLEPAEAAHTQDGVVPAHLSARPDEGGAIRQVGCVGCGGGLGGAGCSGCSGGGVGPAAIDLGGAPASCYPGKYPCDCPAHPTSAIGSFLHGFYHCVCCNDPCYLPVWKALGNAAFFVDQVRPKTQLRLGADVGWDVRFPDKAELFWARIGGRGPALQNGVGERSVDYCEGYLYMEGAVDRFGLFVQLPYRQVTPETYPGGSALGDMSVGTKSLLLDCELMQFTFQFRTYIPTGNPRKGVGTGHTSLEPSVLTAIKITESTYSQCQLAWLGAVGGDSGFQGSLITLGLSLNQMLWDCGKDLQWIGTLEGNAFWITDGLYTDPLTGTALPANELGTMVNVGAGTRFVFCKTIDFGVGVSFAVTDERLVGQLLRTEFRWRF
jgi:hypothetical protein